MLEEEVVEGREVAPEEGPAKEPPATLDEWPQRVHVAAAVIFNHQGEILIARRPKGAHQGGLWEFPGGKVEEGEAVRAALERELLEELSLRPERARPLIRVRHDYPDKSVLLDVWRVDAFTGTAWGREGQQVAWVAPERLGLYDFPAANLPILKALRLPDRCLVTGAPAEEPERFLARLEASLASGVRLVQLRAKGLDGPALARLAEQSLPLCRRHRARLLVNAAPDSPAVAQADGVHLSSRRLMELDARPLPAERWVSASCHNAGELAQAQRIGVDFVLLSPVYVTASHPEVEPLGWRRFHELTDACPLPVFALGGMSRDDLETAWEHGAQGIAAIRGLWVGEEAG